ncbi:hypothetical protein RFI_22110, partial [Reticulomyxa filosa]
EQFVVSITVPLPLARARIDRDLCWNDTMSKAMTVTITTTDLFLLPIGMPKSMCGDYYLFAWTCAMINSTTLASVDCSDWLGRFVNATGDVNVPDTWFQSGMWYELSLTVKWRQNAIASDAAVANAIGIHVKYCKTMQAFNDLNIIDTIPYNVIPWKRQKVSWSLSSSSSSLQSSNVSWNTSGFSSVYTSSNFILFNPYPHGEVVDNIGCPSTLPMYSSVNQQHLTMTIVNQASEQLTWTWSYQTYETWLVQGNGCWVTLTARKYTYRITCSGFSSKDDSHWFPLQYNFVFREMHSDTYIVSRGVFTHVPYIEYTFGPGKFQIIVQIKDEWGYVYCYTNTKLWVEVPNVTWAMIEDYSWKYAGVLEWNTDTRRRLMSNSRASSSSSVNETLAILTRMQVIIDYICGTVMSSLTTKGDADEMTQLFTLWSTLLENYYTVFQYGKQDVMYLKSLLINSMSTFTKGNFIIHEPMLVQRLLLGDFIIAGEHGNNGTTSLTSVKQVNALWKSIMYVLLSIINNQDVDGTVDWFIASNFLRYLFIFFILIFAQNYE